MIKKIQHKIPVKQSGKNIIQEFQKLKKEKKVLKLSDQNYVPRQIKNVM